MGDIWRLADVVDLIATDCESVPFVSSTGVDTDTRLDLRPRRRGRTWTFVNPCMQARQRPCRGQLSLAVPGSPAFARVAFASTGAVRVRIGAVRSRRLVRAGAVTLRVSQRDTRRFGLRRSAALTHAPSRLNRRRSDGPARVATFVPPPPHSRPVVVYGP